MKIPCCALCEKPSPKRRVRAFYLIPGGCSVEYTLCGSCGKRMLNAKRKERQELLQIIEATLEGRHCG